MSEDKENKPCDFSLASIGKREVYAAIAKAEEGDK